MAYPQAVTLRTSRASTTDSIGMVSVAVGSATFTLGDSTPHEESIAVTATPAKVKATSTKVLWALIRADSSNSQNVLLGIDSGVMDQVLVPGQTFQLAPLGAALHDLNDWYIASVSGSQTAAVIYSTLDA